MVTDDSLWTILRCSWSLSHAPLDTSRLAPDTGARRRPATPPPRAAAIARRSRLRAPSRLDHGRPVPRAREPANARNDDGHARHPGTEVRVSSGRLAPGLPHRPVRRSRPCAASPPAASPDRGELLAPPVHLP